MKPLLTIAGILVLITVPALLFAQETVVDVTYSLRQLPTGEPPGQPQPWIIEGSVIATFAANNPIDLAEPDTSMHRVNARTFRHTFLWNWQDAKTVVFVDDMDNEITVVAWPQPPWPFDPTNHQIPVINVRTDSTNLWDPDIGIYVWGNNANFTQTGDLWERPATMDFYDASGALQFSEPIGLRIHGASSRWEDQKPLRFYFDGYGSSDQVVYNFFGSEPTSFRRLIVRNGRYENKLLASNWAETIFQDLGHLGSRYAFVAVYLNGEYWGGYSLKERFDEEFVEHTHHLGADYILIKDNESVHGDIAEWYAFLDSFSAPADYTSHAWFVDRARELDLTSYIDWLLINIFGASPDNGLWWNVAHLKVGNGPWRYLMWDEDDLMYPENLNANFFRLYAAGDEDEYFDWTPPLWNGDWWDEEVERWLNVFNHLMLNSEFKAMFSARLDSLLATQMSIDSLIAQIDDLVAVQNLEMSLHEQRWDDFSQEWYLITAEQYRQYIRDRHPIIVAQKADFMEHFRVPVELSQFAAAAGNGDVVNLDWRTESESDNRGFVVYRSVGLPDNMVEIASYLTHPELVGQLDSSTPTLYHFVDSSPDPNQVNYYRLSHVDLADDETVHNWIESAWLSAWTGLVLNELMADNETVIADNYSQYDDWFELYNGGAYPVLLDGLYVTDDLTMPTKHLFTGGLTIPAGGHLLLWADNEVVQGSDHVAFRLNDEGDELGLFAPDGVTLLDVVTFGRQLDDHSYARYPDGAAWSYAYTSTPGTANLDPRPDLFVRINEILLDNVSINQDEALDYDPWLEIYNPLPVSLSLAGLALSDDDSNPFLWPLPAMILPGQGHLLAWTDNEPGEGPLHTSFRPAAGGGFLGLYNSIVGDNIDSVTYGPQSADQAYARIPDGTASWEFTLVPTPAASNQSSAPPPVLYLNEFLAANSATNQDEAGDYDDWCEIHNPGSDPVFMGGMFLTDDLANPTKWVFPDTVLEAGGYLLVWCDEDASDGPLHANFKLGAGGEEIGLFGNLVLGNPLIDSHVFGPQTTDVSEGRYPNGTGGWYSFDAPSPGTANPPLVGVSDPEGTARFALHPSYPNPAAGYAVIPYFVPGPEQERVRLEVFDVRGRRIRQLVRDIISPGEHAITWDRRDDGGQPAAAGVYFLRLQARGRSAIQKILLVK